MSKRFTDITIWERPWFRKLPGVKKLILKYLFDRCDRAGFLEIDEDRMWFELNIKPFDKPFEGLKDVEIRNGWLRITDFCEFQYPGGLKENDRAHMGVIAKLMKMSSIFEGASKTLPRPFQGCKDKDKDKDKDDKGESEGGDKVFEAFWKAYPAKKGKANAIKAWKKLKCDRIGDLIIAAAERQKTWPEWKKDGGQFIPHPATWLNRAGWEDEPHLKDGDVASSLSTYELKTKLDVIRVKWDQNKDDARWRQSEEGKKTRADMTRLTTKLREV